MTLLPQKLLARLATRLRRSRPGSVLIIVIVLLLLLAILGATYISTTRSARVASAQNVLSDDVDDTLNGLAKICDGIIVDDLNDTFGDLHGNTAYTSNTTIANRSYYQGQAGVTPPVAPDVPASPGGYSPGDIVNDAVNPFIFYNSPQGGTTIATGTAVAPSANPAIGWQVMNGHLPFTANGTDPWLADRIPDPAGTGTPLWQFLSQSIQGYSPSAGTYALAPMSILGTSFEDPRTGPIPPNALSAGPLVGPMTPTSLPLNGVNLPALSNANGTVFLAGDADGDGIADSLLFRIPGMSLDGLTWYAAIRIIDDNSAINANTAWSRDQDYTYAGIINNIWNLFPTSVGLQELINTSDSPDFSVTGKPNLNALNPYRFDDTNAARGLPNPTAQQNPYDESAIETNVPPAAFDRMNGSKDYEFISQGEAFYQQFTRRMANPGYNTYAGGTPPVGARYQALPWSDEAALAYHFCLQNPNSLSQSVIETLLPYSLCGGTSISASSVPYTPYDPSQVNTANGWYPTNFKYPLGSDAVPAPMSLRALLVTHNPVSNYIQQLYNNNGGTAYTSDPILPNYMLPYGPNTNSGAPAPHARGAWNNTATYYQNDIVVFPGPNPPVNPATGATPGITYGGPSYTFICVNPAGVGVGQPPPATITANNTMAVPTAAQLANWQLQPWPSNAVKTNVNTATFRELFRAFWSVMAGNPSNVTPFGSTVADTMANGIYDSTNNNPQYMFRSPLRDPINSAPATATQLDTPPGNALPATYQNTMLLRAALAAVNTLGMRDNTQNIISKTIILNNAWVFGGPSGTGTAAAQTPVEVRVYSSAPQPIISEVYVNTDTGTTVNGTNSAGYVAVELFNPYPVPLSLVNWKLAFVNRPSVTPTAPNLPYPQLQLQAIATLGVAGNPSAMPPTLSVPITIPAYSYLLMENYNAGGALQLQVASPAADPYAATYRPTDTQMPATGVWLGPATPPANPPSYLDLYVPYLENVIAGTPLPPTGSTLSAGGELVLLRPRQSDGQLTTYFDPANDPKQIYAAGSESFNENNLWDLVPIDSYDFTNLQITTAQTSYYAWSYIRGKGTGYLFKGTYPGQYIGNLNVPGQPRESGTALPTGTTIPVGGPVPTIPNGTSPTWTPQPAAGGGTQPYFGMLSAACYPDDFPPVQIDNVAIGTSAATQDWMHFPNSIVSPQQATGTATPYTYPLGGFARNGSMLDIPFIGSYRIRALNPNTISGVTTYSLTYPSPLGVFLELNTVTMDCSLAAITDTSGKSPDPMAEAQNIGRFVPMAATYPYAIQIAAVQAHTQTPPVGQDYYAWTRNLFNYLTVQSSSDAYLPNSDPNVSAEYGWTPSNAGNFAYPPQNAAAPVPPTPTLTANAAATDQTAQDNVGVEGLININTASWKVLSMLPFVPNNSAVDQQIAQNIVNYRLTYGPFTSIFDLNQVPGFQSGTAVGWVPPAAVPAPAQPTAPTSATGLLSPADPKFETSSASTTVTGIPEDYQWDCLTLDRISNLITTRSDTFTIYIVVQGWQNVGAGNAQPVVTRRFAYIVDRNGVNADPSTRYLKTLVVPNN
ncbi:MAG TPA: helix-hairpin-helix domain-containing protein [Tepidisphaeraceae bacterium]|jgi:hypothetical protein|nr:helix-hairpin-helix domain-containing protein [Tepidisphaeraceae bacterium]